MVRAVCSALTRAGVSPEGACEFVIEMSRAAQRRIPATNGPGMIWAWQVEACAQTRLARLAEDS